MRKKPTALRLAREAQGFTIRELRAVTGIATGRLSMLERDMVKPNPSELHRLTAALNASAQQIFPASAGASPMGKKPTALRVAREARGFTIRELTAVTGIAMGRLSMLERDMVKPNASELYRLAEALNASAQQVFPASAGAFPQPSAEAAGAWCEEAGEMGV